MEGIDLSKENEIAIMENVVSKYLPQNNLIYEHNKGIFRLITSDKRFGIIFRGKFWRENIRDLKLKIINKPDHVFLITYKTKGLFSKEKTRTFNTSVVSKILNGGTQIGELISSSKVDKNNFQNEDFKLLNKLYDIYNEYGEKIIEQKIQDEKNENLKKDEFKKLNKEKLRLKEELRLTKLNQSKSNVLSELDKDGNGEVDVIEGNDFNLLLKKHQKSIVEIDRTYVQQFVKISGYLKTKEKNIQSIFNLIKDTPNQEVLNEYVEVLKDDIHSYNLILFNSLNMIVSLVEDDMITFYEIHEMFDTLNMFDSKHEKDVSQKLTNIGDGLKDLMYEIRRMGDQISDSICELTYVTEQSNEQLTDQLSEIDSTMKVGNLISTINTYQNYKNNRRLNS
ncbi:hypothetical protein OAC92_03040 [Polaribacter sp.]|nr:hypothetical protein [Polaribacter sp.]